MTLQLQNCDQHAACVLAGGMPPTPEMKGIRSTLTRIKAQMAAVQSGTHIDAVANRTMLTPTSTTAAPTLTPTNTAALSHATPTTAATPRQFSSLGDIHLTQPRASAGGVTPPASHASRRIGDSHASQPIAVPASLGAIRVSDDGAATPAGRRTGGAQQQSRAVLGPVPGTAGAVPAYTPRSVRNLLTAAQDDATFWHSRYALDG